MDPNRFKHPAIILATIRSAVEPSLLAAGFQFDGRNKPDKPLHLYVDYARKDQLFRLAWDRRDSNRFIGIIAEIIQEPDQLITIAEMKLSELARVPRDQITTEIQKRIDPFAETVKEYLRNLTIIES